MRYFLIAGEPSGDQHASMLMRAILVRDPAAEFRFFGGDLMERVGGTAVIHIRDLAFMGFTQLILKVFAIQKAFRSCKTAITEFNPDVVIPVDYGGFNLRMIRWLKPRKFSTAYYITPKVWAWNPSRARKLALYADKCMCILPFEEDYLKKSGVSSEYVGNPVQEYVKPIMEANQLMIRNILALSGNPVIALLPGSRAQEISRILPVMSRVIPQFKGYQFVIAGHGNFPDDYYKKYCGDADIIVVHGKTLELLRIADAALVTSGTATLETALLGVPQVVCYRTVPLSYLIARLLIRVKYISLVNLILDRPCIQELIQQKCNAANLGNSLKRLLNDKKYRDRMLQGYSDLNRLLGDRSASSAAADIVCGMAAGSR